MRMGLGLPEGLSHGVVRARNPYGRVAGVVVRRPAMRVLLLVLLAAVAHAEPRPRVVLPGPSWVTTSCWIEPRWFETLRYGPVDYCKRSLRFRPGKIDCVAYTDKVCWALNQVTGDWQQLRSAGNQTLFQCPEGPEPPTCPRMR
jgi:hypothetical protein